MFEFETAFHYITNSKLRAHFYIKNVLLFFSVFPGTVFVGQTNGPEAIYGSTVELVCTTDAITGIDWYKRDVSEVPVDLPKSLSFCLEETCVPSSVGKYSFSSNKTNKFVNIPAVNEDDEKWWICVIYNDYSTWASFYLDLKGYFFVFG